MKKAQNKTKTLLILLVLLITSAVLCSCSGSKEKEDKVVKIGIVGSYKSIMEKSAEFLWGIDLAINDLERAYEKYGYTVETEFFDDQSVLDETPKKATEALNRDDIDVVFVYGAEGNLESAAKKLNKGSKVVFWMDEKGQNYRLIEEKNQFYPVYRLKAQAEAVMKTLSDEGVYSVAMVYKDEDYSAHIYNTMTLAAKKFGIQVIKTVDLKRQSSEEVIDSLLIAEPQAVALLCNDGEKNAELVGEVKKQIPDAYILSDYSIDSSKIIDDYGTSLDGTIIPCNVQTKWEEERLKTVIERYEGIYNGKSQLGKVTHGYFSTMAVVDGIITCGTSDAKLLGEYFRSERSNIYKFDEFGDLIYDEIPVLQAENGVFEIMDTVEFELVEESE